MKLSARSIAFRYDLVKNDNFLTVFNGIKIFFEIDSKTCYHRVKSRKYHPLSTFGRKKPSIFFYVNNLYYLTHRFMRFRNQVLKIRKKHYHSISFFRQVRPLNRLFFFYFVSKAKEVFFYITCLDRI